ncbi:MAG: hypothetical protein GY744_06840 [Gammaproteobacteria bacterium]|nr:hypothetical protein [Gammaproteobacteria bacterium]
MNKKSKYTLFGTALLVVATGSVYAFNGYGNCDQRGPGMQRGQYNQMQGNMYGQPPMHWKQGKRGQRQMAGMKGGSWKQGKRGQRQMAGMKGGSMRGIYRLNDLTPEQHQKLEVLQQTQQDWKNGQQIARQAHRDEMRSKVDSILTEEQRQTLNRWRPTDR